MCYYRQTANLFCFVAKINRFFFWSENRLQKLQTKSPKYWFQQIKLRKTANICVYLFKFFAADFSSARIFNSKDTISQKDIQCLTLSILKFWFGFRLYSRFSLPFRTYRMDRRNIIQSNQPISIQNNCKRQADWLFLWYRSRNIAESVWSY